MNWLLPEYLSDALPAEAANVERLRREILDLFRVRAYELVIPPHLEYIESLLTGAGQDLNLRTFKLVDQLSGRTLGVRADMTPQVARIDAHLLNRQGVTRLCYCDSVLHTLPASIAASREPVQLGAEIYGYAGVAADLEVICLMASVLERAKLSDVRIDLGHVGIFNSIVESAGLSVESTANFFSLLQAKDVSGLADACADYPENSPVQALTLLPSLYGGQDILVKARSCLPALPGVTAALNTLETVFAELPELCLSVDLSDFRGYLYHNGLVFAAYCAGYPAAIAQGGRYDGAGAAFGRVRPATGFSTDLRELARLGPSPVIAKAILAPYVPGDAALVGCIGDLRAQGEIVVESLPGDIPADGPVCDRKLALNNGGWEVQSL
ncbi:MAG: hypothetical protein RIR18_1885 [Pseudomonadota bacterium]|jgi:ATP phosphoribosyltransferase regulatory subunit